MSAEYYANSEPVAFVGSADWVPTALAHAGQAYTRTTALQCVTSGTCYVDWLGTAPGVPGTLNDPVVMTAGQLLTGAITKVHFASTTGTYRAFY